MKKITKNFFGVTAGLSVVIAGLSAPVFAEEGPRKIVTFVDEGTTVSQQIVQSGDCLFEPEALGKDGYVFRGWFDGDEEADFWTCDQTVSEDRETKTYTAKYVEADFRVNFMTSEDRLGATVFTSQNVEEGGVATEPTSTPERAGYAVSAWEDKNHNVFDFSTPITENIDLYPVFSPAETTYKVFIYKENEDDEGAYVLVDDDELTGLTGSEISLSDAEIDAYLSALKNNAYYELDRVEKDDTVKADGTSEVEIYFKRKEYTITFEAPLVFIIEPNGNHRGTYTINGVKIGQSTSANWATGLRTVIPATLFTPARPGLNVPYRGWQLDGSSTIFTQSQTIYTAEMLGDGSQDALTYSPAYLLAPNQGDKAVETDDEINEEHLDAETDPVYVTVQVQYIDYDYEGVATIHTDEYKFVRGEGGLALVPGYTGNYPEASDSFVGWTAYDEWDLPYQTHHTSADYFFENDLINVDAFADVFCELDEDCLLRFYAVFDFEPEDGWFQEIEDEEEPVEEVEEENPLTLDNVYVLAMVNALALAGVATSFALTKKEKRA